jgi:urease accessory protein UreH
MSRRHARGEHWKFASLAHEIAVSRDGCLEYLERYRIEPNELAVTRPWAAGDAAYLGTTLMSGRPIEPGVAERLHVELGRLAGVRAAADRLDDRMLLVRLLGVSGAAFHDARRWIGDYSASLRPGRHPSAACRRAWERHNNHERISMALQGCEHQLRSLRASYPLLTFASIEADILAVHRETRG